MTGTGHNDLQYCHYQMKFSLSQPPNNRYRVKTERFKYLCKALLVFFSNHLVKETHGIKNFHLIFLSSSPLLLLSFSCFFIVYVPFDVIALQFIHYSMSYFNALVYNMYCHLVNYVKIGTQVHLLILLFT